MRTRIERFIILLSFLTTGESTLGGVHVDLAEVARLGGETEWTLHAVTNYASNGQAMKFADADSFALSPDFGETIVAATMRVVSSSATRRRLKVIPCSTAGETLPGEVALDYSSSKSAFTNQTVRWTEDLGVRRIRLAYDAGAKTVWGALSLDVTFASDPPAGSSEGSEGEDDASDTPDDGSTLPANDEIVSFENLMTNGTLTFTLDPRALVGIKAKTNVSGYVSLISCHLRKGASREETFSPNEGTTQYQGHYLWKTNGVPSGIGSYSAAQTSRSFGWLFKNDTGRPLLVDAVDVVYGQWGARNALPDSLAAEWRIGEEAFDIGESAGWTPDPEGSFTTPFTNNAPDLVLPVFCAHSLTAFPATIPAKAFFALRFVDTCPASGNNAALGIASLTLRGRRITTRPLMLMIR